MINMIQYTNSTSHLKKVNYKKAFVIFLLSQIAVSGPAWGTHNQQALANANAKPIEINDHTINDGLVLLSGNSNVHSIHVTKNGIIGSTTADQHTISVANGVTKVTIKNEGMINNTGTGEIRVIDASLPTNKMLLQITNESNGTIQYNNDPASDAIYTNHNTNTILINRGKIIGNIELSNANDVTSFANGHLQGDLKIFPGDNSVTFLPNNNTITGNINGDIGNDTITFMQNSNTTIGGADGITLGGGANVINFGHNSVVNLTGPVSHILGNSIAPATNALYFQGNFTATNLNIINPTTISLPDADNGGISGTKVTVKNDILGFIQRDLATTAGSGGLHIGNGRTLKIDANGEICGPLGGVNSANTINNGNLIIAEGGSFGRIQSMGDLTNNGVVNITTRATNGGIAASPANTLSIASLTNNANGTINITNNSNANGCINITGAIVNAANATMIITNNDTLILAGSPINLVSGGGPNFLLQNSGDLTIKGLLAINSNLNNNPGANITFVRATPAAGSLPHIDLTGGNFINNGVATFKDTTAFYTGHYTIGNNSTHEIYISNNIPSNVSLNNGSLVEFLNPAAVPAEHCSISVINQNSFLQHGQQLTIFQGTVAHTNSTDANLAQTVVIKNNSKALSYNISNDPAHANHIILTVNRTPYSLLVSNKSAASVAAALDNVTKSNRTAIPLDLQSIINNLDNLKTKGEVENAIQQLAPDLNMAKGIQDSVVSSTTAAFETMNDRLDQIARLDVTNFKTGITGNIRNIQSGYSAGGMMSNRNIWLKGFGATNQQKALQETSGYNANTGGFTFGGDLQTHDNIWMGLGISYSNTHIKTKDYPTKKTKIDHYLATVYGSYTKDQYYVDGFVSAGFNKYKTIRNIEFGGISRTAYGKFNGMQPSMKIASGYINSIGNYRIIPNASLHYTYLHQQKYNESGARAIDLINTTSKNLQRLEGGLGIKFAMFHQNNQKTINPDLHVMALYDFIGHKQQCTTELEGGGGAFKVEGNKPARTTFNVGAGITYSHKDTLNFTFNYDLRAKKKFVGHSGSLAVKYAI